MLIDDIKSYVDVNLGVPIVNSDLKTAMLTELEKLVLRTYNRHGGKLMFGTVNIVGGRTDYAIGLPRGPIIVQFVPRTVAPPTLDAYFFGRSYSPIQSLDTQTYDLAQHHFAMVRRIVGQEPEWHWDEFTKKLYLHLGGLSDQSAGAIVSMSYYVGYSYISDVTGLAEIPSKDEEWILRYALANAKKMVGHGRRKFGGGIPGPGGVVQMDGQQLIDEGTAEEAVCMQEARSWRQATPVIG